MSVLCYGNWGGGWYEEGGGECVKKGSRSRFADLVVGAEADARSGGKGRGFDKDHNGTHGLRICSLCLFEYQPDGYYAFALHQ